MEPDKPHRHMETRQPIPASQHQKDGAPPASAPAEKRGPSLPLPRGTARFPLHRPSAKPSRGHGGPSRGTAATATQRRQPQCGQRRFLRLLPPPPPGPAARGGAPATILSAARHRPPPGTKGGQHRVPDRAEKHSLHPPSIHTRGSNQTSPLPGTPLAPAPTHLQAEGGTAAPQELADVAQALTLRPRLRVHLQEKRRTAQRGASTARHSRPPPLCSPHLPLPPQTAAAAPISPTEGVEPGSKHGAQEMACEGSGRRAGAQAGVSRARRGPGRLGSAELGSAPLRSAAGRAVTGGRAGRRGPAPARPQPQGEGGELR